MFTPANDTGPPPLEVSPEDLRRYVAGDLSASRRRDIEGFLACNPDLAAHVMTALHQRVRQPRRAPVRQLAIAAVALVISACSASAFAGWRAAEHRDLDGWREGDGDLPPEYVEEAAESRQASLARAAMASQVETPSLDVAEIRRTLRLDLPRLPRDWRIVDVQVYPTDEGPSVNVTAVSPGGKRLSLFVVRADTSTTERPELATRGREAVAFWERGSSAYVLSGEDSRSALLSHAATLSEAKTL